MKYLFLNASLTNGGSERVMAILASQFAINNNDTFMLLLRDNKSSNYKVNDKLKCYQLHYNTRNKLVILVKRFFLVRKYIKKINPDVIISFMWDINLFTLIVSLGLRKKIIISERALPTVKFKSAFKTFVRNFGQKYIYKLADVIVLQTPQVKQYYSKKIQKKCVVIPNPIDNSLPKRWDKKREKVVVAVGRCTEQKNFAMLLNAFARFYTKHKDYKLVIYGDGPLLSDLKKQAKYLQIDSVVEFPGYVSNVDEKIRKSAIYVSSSNYEGISNSMLEALAMGVPSICTDCPVGGASMVIDNGVNGILIPVGDEDALYHSLLKLAIDEDFAKSLSLEASKLRYVYEPEKIYQMWKEL